MLISFRAVRECYARRLKQHDNERDRIVEECAQRERDVMMKFNKLYVKENASKPEEPCVSQTAVLGDPVDKFMKRLGILEKGSDANDMRKSVVI